jgi:geranyl-CoA carboxylase alpha subunit
MKSARKLGYRTVAIFSEADSSALHVKVADVAIAIGGNAPADSYLSIEKILEACTKSGADAVHPGYGFLSENADFAQACSEKGVVFIGPSARAIHLMGNKSRSKDLMITAGVPCIPGYQGAQQEQSFLIAKSKEIGFPLMIKSAAGGGGRGLRLATNADELPELLQSARKEAEKAFGSGELLLERALTDARHVEIQIFGDHHGNVIHLGERDCSIQRRHQKVIEESPSPAVTSALRNEMGMAAVRAAKAIDYVGAGTVEFLLDKDGRFYFLEMNTRLQVEHPVTEMIASVDMVAWQLDVAAGKPLPEKQEEISLTGHAIEARLYAEDPDDQFRSQVGVIHYFSPPSTDLARSDHGLNQVDAVSPYYDSMLGKIITHGADRETARRRLVQALADTTLLGTRTNREFLLHCLEHEQFIAAETDTGFIARTWAPGSATKQPAPESRRLDSAAKELVIATVLLINQQQSAYGDLGGWSSNGCPQTNMSLALNDSASTPVQPVHVEYLQPSSWRIAIADKVSVVCNLCITPFSHDKNLHQVHLSQVHLSIDGVQHKARFMIVGDDIYIATSDATYKVSDQTYRRRRAANAVCDGDVLSPSNGLVSSVDVKLGQHVQKGTLVCTIEAMKLVQAIYAPMSGIVAAALVKPGQQVKPKQLLLQIAASNQELVEKVERSENAGSDHASNTQDASSSKSMSEKSTPEEVGRVQ